MRYNLAIATLAILVIGIVSCSQSVPTPTPASVVTSEPTPVPVEPSVAAPASGQIAVASTSTPVPAEPVAANPTSAAVAVEKSVSIPQVIAPGPTPSQETPAVTPKVSENPFTDTPAPTPSPATVPPSVLSSPEPAPTGPRLTGKVVLVEAQELFSQRGLVLEPELAKVSVLGLDGSRVAVGGHGDSFSFTLPAGAAYLLKAKTVDGAVLWALTPVLGGDTTQDITLETTYQAGLIYAAESGIAISGQSVGDLKEKAKTALDVGADRLVNTVKRVVNNDLLWRVDYSINTEMNEVTLRAFGGGLSPVRSLDSLVDDPQPDYVPHIYMLNTAAGEPFLDRILMSEMKADRWAAIVVAEDIPPRVYRGLGGLHVIHGGKTVAYGEDKCFDWTVQGTERECRVFRQVLVTYPLDAPAGVSPTVVIDVGDFHGANRPQWSWDEKRIAFDAFPEGRQGRTQIFVIDRDGGGARQLTAESEGQNGAREANWSPDNSQMVYFSDRESFSWDIWLMNSDGSGQENLTKGRVKFPSGPKFSPDGRRILFYANDDELAAGRRGGPDSELWIMDRDGAKLTKIPDNDVDDENAVWGLNGMDVVYSVNNRTWEAADAITGKKLFEFPGVARGKYVSPVLAATGHVLIPTQAAIEEKKVDEKGYVDRDWLKARLEIKPGSSTASSTTGAQSRSGYRVTTPSKDPISGIRYEIYNALTQTGIYNSYIGGYLPPIISWP